MFNNLYQTIHLQRMTRYAALSDLKDKKNLLILDGINGYCWQSSVYVEYLDDGAISIEGSSDIRTWYPIGELTLDRGRYIFTGLENVNEKTVALELEQKNEYGKYIEYLDIGPVSSARFEVTEKSDFRVCVGVYPVSNCNEKAKPAIYRLGD